MSDTSSHMIVLGGVHSNSVNAAKERGRERERKRERDLGVELATLVAGPNRMALETRQQRSCSLMSSTRVLGCNIMQLATITIRSGQKGVRAYAAIGLETSALHSSRAQKDDAVIMPVMVLASGFCQPVSSGYWGCLCVVFLVFFLLLLASSCFSSIF